MCNSWGISPTFTPVRVPYNLLIDSRAFSVESTKVGQSCPREYGAPVVRPKIPIRVKTLS